VCCCTCSSAPNQRWLNSPQAVPSDASPTDGVDLRRGNNSSEAPRNEGYNRVSGNAELESIRKRSKTGVCKIVHIEKDTTSGTGFLCKILISCKRSKGKLKYAYVVGVVTSTHVIHGKKKHLKASDIERVLKYYEMVFEKDPNSQQAAYKLRGCDVKHVILLPRRLDAVFLVPNESTVNYFFQYAFDVLHVNENAAEKYYKEGRSFYLAGYPNGGPLRVYEGKIGPSEKPRFSHNADTSIRCSGGPLEDKKTKKVIGIHKGSVNVVVKRKPVESKRDGKKPVESKRDGKKPGAIHEPEDYHKQAVMIFPIVKEIEQYFRVDPDRRIYLYIVTVDQQSDNNTLEQAEEEADQRRSERRHSEEQSQSTPIAPDINKTPIMADAEAALADTDVAQPTSATPISLTRSESADMMSLMSTVDTRRRQSHTMEFSDDQASTSAAASLSALHETW
jgi:hypothetical protein